MDSASDYDSDDCQDSSEDLDDDGDGVADSTDDCSVGEMGWSPSAATDHDSDECHDSLEDDDDDDDGIGDASDSCATRRVNAGPRTPARTTTPMGALTRTWVGLDTNLSGLRTGLWNRIQQLLVGKGPYLDVEHLEYDSERAQLSLAGSSASGLCSGLPWTARARTSSYWPRG